MDSNKLEHHLGTGKDLLFTYITKDSKSLLPYIKSYPALLNFARKSCDDDNEASLIALSTAVYGWMPTILKNWDFDSFPDRRRVFHDIRSIPSKQGALKFIKDIKSKAPVNNSWVGTSKLLHFIKPEFFPIWDSNVAECFKVTTYHQLKKKENYVEYSKVILERSSNHQSDFNSISDFFSKKFSYRPSPIRMLELCLFLSGKKTREIRKDRLKRKSD